MHGSHLATAALALTASAALASPPVTIEFEFLPGWDMRNAHVINHDGSMVVVSNGSDNTGNQPARWTRDGGLEYYTDPRWGLRVRLDIQDVTPDGRFFLVDDSRIPPGPYLYVDGGEPILFATERNDLRPIALSDDGSAVAMSEHNSYYPVRWDIGVGPTLLLWLPTPARPFAVPSGISADGAVVVGRSRGPNGTSAARWSYGGVPQELGDLPGGDHYSFANDTNADGSVVVGAGTSEQGLQAVRWSEREGLVGLGDLPGGEFRSEALAVSADGSVVVGRAKAEYGNDGFLWTRETGLVSIAEFLTAFGVDLNGHWIVDASLVSGDGLTIVGHAAKSVGDSRVWVATVHAPSPAAAWRLVAVTLDSTAKDTEGTTP